MFADHHFPAGSRSAPRASNLTRKVKGFAMISTLLALIIAAMLTKTQLEAQQLNAQLKAGEVEAGVINLIAEATNAYAMENYPALQMAMNVSKNGIVLANGTGVGQSMSPTVANLIDMGYLPIGTSAQSIYIPGGSYQIRLRREPALCTGTACNIPGVVYVDRAATLFGSTQMNAPMINGFTTRLGAPAMISTNSSPANLVAMSGAAMANPLGAVEGVIGSAAGFGAAGFGRFLTLGDPRDPNFQGEVTVNGKLESRTNVAVTNAADTCDVIQMVRNAGNFGELLTRGSTCAVGAWVNGTGVIGVSNGAGGPKRVEMDGGAATMTVYAADGTTPRAGFVYNGASESVAFAENLRNNATAASGNQAGISSTGEVYGRQGRFNTAVLSDYRNVGTACTSEGEMTWTNINGSPVPMKCMSGSFVIANGAPLVNNGGACSTEGRTATDSTGVGMICEGGIYKPTLQRIGPMQMDNAVLVSSGSVVTKPGCAPGGTQAIYLLPNRVDASSGAFTYKANNTGSTWTVEIRDNDDLISWTSQAIAQVACVY